MRLITLVAALCATNIYSVFAFPSPSPVGKVLVARQAVIDQLNAAQAEYDASWAALTATKNLYPELLNVVTEPKNEPADLVQARTRWRTAETNLKAAKEAVLVAPDAPRESKLAILNEKKVDAEKAVSDAIYRRENNYKTTTRSIETWTRWRDEETDPVKKEGDQLLIDGLVKHRSENLVTDSLAITDANEKLAQINAQITAT